MEWPMSLPRSWYPIATGLFGGAVVLLVLRKTFMKFIGVTDKKDEVDERPYVEVMSRIIGVTDTVPYIAAPTKLLDFLYIGSEFDAKNMPVLDEIGITHVINTVDGHIGGLPQRKELYGGNIQYLNFLAQDRRYYIIMQHFNVIYDFIESARACNGKVLIHCSLGINRSGALAAAYIMVHKEQGPLTTVEYIKNTRGHTLTNPSFREQLIHFANRRGLLILDEHYLEHSKYGTNSRQQESERARDALEEKVRTKDEKIKLLFKEINS